MEHNPRKNNGKRTYQLVKDLTTVKQGKVITVQDRSGKCFTEERAILNRWTDYCSELYNRKAHGYPSAFNCPQTDRTTTPSFAKKRRLHYNYGRKGSQLELTTAQQNWPKQVDRTYLPLALQYVKRSGRQENGQSLGPST